MRRSTLLCLTAALAAFPIASGCDSESLTNANATPPSFDATITPASMPYYARVERPFTVHTDTWAAIVFYRPPECVPADFNLLDFFDIPGAFSCGPQTVEGFDLWKAPGPPWQQVLSGLGAVPIWLVAWSELEAALQDNVLTRAELEVLPSTIVGSATQFQELLQPFPARIPPRLVISASGLLADGRNFRVHFNESKQVRIDVW